MSAAALSSLLDDDDFDRDEVEDVNPEFADNGGSVFSKEPSVVWSW